METPVQPLALTVTETESGTFQWLILEMRDEANELFCYWPRRVASTDYESANAAWVGGYLALRHLLRMNGSTT
ncbi:MAG: hypothetical protein JWQ03_2005 [Variovorax sp.]|nr:hypothetical protein [Variovorax sp.]